MRLTTAVGQTHGCYLLNKLLSYVLSGFRPDIFQVSICLCFVISGTKIEIIFEKKVHYLYFLHIFAPKMYKYSK